MSSLETFESFLELIDLDVLFRKRSSNDLVELRSSVLAALHNLLVWERPQLESRHGLLWPYEQLAARASYFQDTATGRRRSHATNAQAKRFLALLPFPDQWRHLRDLEARNGDDPELSAYVELEQDKITRKFRRKADKTFKLRHFCQVLKAPRGPEEKGVLRIFSLPYLFTYHGVLKKLSRKYVLYVEPPMGVVFRHSWWRHFAGLEEPCLFGVGGEEDRAFLDSQTGITTTQLAHGDFLIDRPLASQTDNRDFDLVFNATFDDMARKRHDLMLQLLRSDPLKDFRALFLGRGQEHHVAEFVESVRRARLEQRVTVRSNLFREQIPDLLARCRVGVHLSLYENACRSIYEFFRADIPCVISSSMAGMNLDIFNPQTGLAVQDRELASAIAHVLQHRDSYCPRKWFSNHSGSNHSSRQLNELLRGLFFEWGLQWTEDIVPLASSGASRYVKASELERFQKEFQFILDCFLFSGTFPVGLTLR